MVTLKMVTLNRETRHDATALQRSIGALAALGIGSLCVLGAARPAFAAEQIVLNYRWLQRSLPVADLTHLARTGEPSPQLRRYLRAIDQRPGAFQRLLTRQVSLDPRLLDQALNNPLGSLALDQISPVIHTRSGEGDRLALRAALVLSASDDGQVSLIELIETYPTQEVVVEGDRLADTYRDIADLRDRIERWTSWFGFL